MEPSLQILDRYVGAAGKGFDIWLASRRVQACMVQIGELAGDICAFRARNVCIEAKVYDVEYGD